MGLTVAASLGHVRLVAHYLQEGVSVNQKDSFSATPLIWATRQQHKAVVELLLRQEEVGSYEIPVSLLH